MKVVKITLPKSIPGSRRYTAASTPPYLEVCVGRGLPALTIAFRRDQEVRSAREILRAGITNAGFHFPECRTTIIPPVGVDVEPQHFPQLALPMALGILASSDQIETPNGAAWGELSLDGHELLDFLNEHKSEVTR